MTIVNEQLLTKLQDYFAKRDDVVLAYLFGSQAKGTASPNRSDADFAIYFKPKTGVFEYEESEWGSVDYSYEAESVIQDDLSRITDKEVDLVVLNRAPAHLVATILKEGITLKENDRAMFLELWSRSLDDAEEYYEMLKDYWQIMKRSHSLSEKDKERLLKILPFLESELVLLQEYSKIDQIVYMHDDVRRKVLERSVENVANAGLDIAKILLASHTLNVPDKYAELMLALAKIKDFDFTIANEMREAAKLRNFLAHEYLDYRWPNIQKFICGAQKNFGYLITFTERILADAEAAPSH